MFFFAFANDTKRRSSNGILFFAKDFAMKILLVIFVHGLMVAGLAAGSVFGGDIGGSSPTQSIKETFLKYIIRNGSFYAMAPGCEERGGGKGCKA